MNKREGWFATRPYAHFDRPLPFAVAKCYVTNPKNVERQSFHPLLYFEIKQRRYKVRRHQAEVGSKNRPLGIPSHVDGYIFAYYARLLEEPYEKYLEANALNEHVLAYRRGIGSNVDFSQAAFAEIRRRGRCVAMAFDLEKFFETIDHRTLKENWSRLLGAGRLPADHYAVFSAVTRHATISVEACRARLKIPENARLPRPICTPSVFRNVVKRHSDGSLVKVNREPFGIPQGSQISALLSNIYMMRFDLEMKELTKEVAGYYRRYSDDILWICDPEKADIVRARLNDALTNLGGTTTLNENKTDISHFSAVGFDAYLECNRPFQYLGFVFDGAQVRIRSQTLSKFWRRVVYASRATLRAARNSTVRPGVPYKRELFRRFSHLGHRNLLSYAKRSEDIMRTGGIQRQLRRHMPRLLKAVGKRK